MNFYQFASESPWLTFFLFSVVAEAFIRVAVAFRRGDQ